MADRGAVVAAPVKVAIAAKLLLCHDLRPTAFFALAARVFAFKLLEPFAPDLAAGTASPAVVVGIVRPFDVIPDGNAISIEAGMF